MISNKLMRLYIPLLIWTSAVLTLLPSCTEDSVWAFGDEGVGSPIEIGVDAADMLIAEEAAPQSRAAGETMPAEQVAWLIQPLKKGLDITYGKVGKPATKREAILKLQGGTSNDDIYDTNPNSGYAVYTFTYRAADGTETTEKARWMDNGAHYFEGVLVPNRIRYTNVVTELEQDRTLVNGSNTTVTKVEHLTTNQSGDVSVGDDGALGNYTLLSHYLGMPANTHISATVSRIILPFRHRLAHVLAYILIDPTLETTIKGYAKSVEIDGVVQGDDPNSSSIRFCNVDVLAGVKDVYDGATQLHTLTPTWAEKVRKVVPHFYGEESQIVAYIGKKESFYPKSQGYSAINAIYLNAYNKAISGGKSEVDAVAAGNKAVADKGYERMVFSEVPIYDLIVRPTYTSYDNVMYDEAGYNDETERQKIADRKNKIDFLVTLENGLTYEKEFVFDLDANYETIVYLHISREGIDYNTSGSEKWKETTSTDWFYGVDNKNGNKLSIAGSSWQRAYTRRKDSYVNDGGDKVTDGGFYDEGTTGEDDATGQYLSEKTWIKYFSEAYEGGAHHGDYFNLSLDMEIDARLLPDSFVFTGHLDAFGQEDLQYHTITLTHTGEEWKEYQETTNYALYEQQVPLYTTKPEGISNVVTAQFALPESLYEKVPHPAVYYAEDELATVNGVSYVKTTLQSVNYTDADLYTIGGKTYDKSTLLTHPIEGGTGTEYYVGAGSREASHDYVVLPSSVKATTATVKTPAWDEYIQRTPTLAQVMAGEYYVPDGPGSYKLYVKPSVFYIIIPHTSGTALFAGLNGIYSTKQETTPNYTGEYEANVHKEGDYWIPYKDDATRTGWRAEVLNLTVKGAKLFSDVEKITGNVENCKENTNQPVSDHRPAMPVYK